jgi:hypothetical protein
MTPGSEWFLLAQGASSAPLARYAHLLVLDSTRDRLVLFGGEERFQLFNDVWTFDNASLAWTQLNPSGPTPGKRYGMRGFYDPVRDRLVLVGGYDRANILNDVWELDFQPSPHWAQIVPTGPLPSVRLNQAVVFDAPHDRLVMFGGLGTFATTLHDTWALNLTGPPVWTNLNPSGTPPDTTIDQAVILDPVRNRLVVFGGYELIFSPGNYNSYSTQAFALDLAIDPPHWSQLALDGASGPFGRAAMASAYDATNDRLVLLGGQGKDILNTGESGPRALADTWALSWDRATPTLLSFVDYDAGPGRVTLRWEASDAADVAAMVERSTDGSAWTTLGTPRLEGTDLLAYDDLGVAPGRYSYRLAYTVGSLLRFSDPVVVDVPASVNLALRGFQPNPATSRSAIVFSLPDARPTRLEVVDVRGKIMLSREVGTLGPGTHSLSLSESGRLGAGVYWLRLVRPDATLTRKGVVAG